jgi:hypothetical protein
MLPQRLGVDAVRPDQACDVLFGHAHPRQRLDVSSLLVRGLEPRSGHLTILLWMCALHTSSICSIGKRRNTIWTSREASRLPQAVSDRV